MKKNPFGKRSKLRVAPISIGGMRLPGEGIDAVELIRHAIDSGMRYIDTCRAYGESEWLIGKALKSGYRKKVILSTKCSPWIRKVHDTDNGSADSVLRRIEESLLRLDVNYLDFYQVWNINGPEAWKTATKKGGMVDGIRKAKKRGLVKHIGFTTHDSVENLQKNLPKADWCEIILITYNLLNKTYAPVLETAHNLGIGTIVMNPMGGGMFAEKSPVFAKLAKSLKIKSVPELATRYVLSNPHVTTQLCGVNKISDVDDTIKAAEKGPFSKDELAHIENFLFDISPAKTGFCTECRYCMPCPAGINIPAIMGAVYKSRYLGMKQAAKNAYRWAGEVKAEGCVKCGKCEKKCTQALKIMKDMAYAKKELA